MQKPLSPEILALAPNGIENVILHCAVCGGDLPRERRTVGDHAGDCHKVRKLHRRYMIQQTKCISCLHPSTPEERRLFKLWRRASGHLREQVGRPPEKLRRALAQAIEILRQYAAPEDDFINSEVQKLQKILDKALDKTTADFPTPSVVVSLKKKAETTQDIA